MFDYHLKKLTRKTLTFGLVLLCFSAASAQKVDSTDFFTKLRFYKDTLYIKARFIECGEWGGHLELAKIYLKQNEYYLTYQKYKADCSKVKENNGEPSQTLEQIVEKNIFDKDKRLIKQYALLLTTAKFREPDPMNAGYVFEMKNTDESLKIYVYTWGRTTRDEYLNFIVQLLK